MAGSGTLAGDENIHAFLWDGTTLLDLGTLEDTSSLANAINTSGQVTGTLEVATEILHAFLWDGTMMQDLNALIDPADPLQPFVTLVNGIDINDRGQILANGIDRRGGFHAYLSPRLACPNPARSRCSAWASRVSALRDDAAPRKRRAQRSTNSTGVTRRSREGTMNTHAIRSTLVGSLGVALALASGSALAISFRITDLGTLGGTFSSGIALNASGQVTGVSATAGGATHAFLWDGTAMRDLGTLGGRFSGHCHQRLGAGDGHPIRTPIRPIG